MNEYGFFRTTCITPRVVVADPMANADEIIRACQEHVDSDIILTPELSIPSYSAMKLFHQTALIEESIDAAFKIAKEVNPDQLVVVGLALPIGNALYNCAAVLNDGRIIGVVPKEFVPNYNEFEEGQWFASAREEDTPDQIQLRNYTIPFGTRLIFESRKRIDHRKNLVVKNPPKTEPHRAKVFIEVCEAIWMTIPPSSFAQIAGANIILNPSSSTETIGKSDQRRTHVLSQSGRGVGAYAYCSSGPTESTNDVVFGGHNMIAECGSLLSESDRVGDENEPNRETYSITSDIDVERIQNDRRAQTSYIESSKFIRDMSFRTIYFEVQTHVAKTQKLKRTITAFPFVPKGAKLVERCAEIFGIQSCALAKRLECLGHTPKLSIGISGGLDSTLALLVTLKVLEMLGLSPKCIQAATMIGFGTTSKTLTNAKKLMEFTEVTAYEFDIRPACWEEYKLLNSVTGYKPFGIDIGEMPNGELGLAQFEKALKDLPPNAQDLVFENVQARRRTEYLMNMGFVLGTGDMSELFQGWCTYNADHQSMYNANCSIPKTLVKFLVKYIADYEYDGPARDVLLDIAGTEISPELLPHKEDQIVQSTESMIGPYELIDFLMFNMIRYGFSPAKILYLMDQADDWEQTHTRQERISWMKIHLKRFFNQQYKRDDVPNGPKVGSVSLSPRAGNWRMPCEAIPTAWIKSLEEAK